MFKQAEQTGRGIDAGTTLQVAWDKAQGWVFPGLMVLLLVVLEQSGHHLLFHTVAEFFAISVALIAFVVAWYTFGFSHNHYLLFLGIGYFWIAVLDGMHTLTFRGMPVFDNAGGNLTSQYWIVTRYLEAVLILVSPLFLTRSLKPIPAILLFGGITAGVIYILTGGLFPTTFILGEGPTPFKILSEYIIIGFLLFGIAHIYVKRKLLHTKIFTLMVSAIALTILAEVSFTVYTDLVDFALLVGHVFKLLSYWLLFVAIIHTTLTEPFSALARNANSFDAIPDPTIVVDQDGIIQQANGAACREIGIPLSDINGQHCHNLFHPTDPPPDGCPLCQAIRTNEPLIDSRYHSKEVERWWTYALTPMDTPDHRRRMVHVRKDSTRRARATEQLRILNSAISQVHSSVLITDKDGTIVFVNSTFEAVSGYSREEAIGQTPRLLRSGQTPRSVYARMWERLLSKRPWRGELLNKKKNGELYWEEMTISPVVDDHGNISHFIAIKDDISKRRETEDTILRLGRMLDDSLNQIFVFDKETLKIVQSNKGTRNALGYSQQQLETMTPCDFMDNMDEVQFRRHLAALQDGATQYIHMETTHKDLNGNTRHMHLRVRLIETETPPVYMAVGEDVSEKLQIEEALRHAGKMEGIGRLTGGVAHDFNNLLGIIIGNLDMLEEDMQAAGQQDSIELAAVKRAAMRGADLTSRLLAFSRHSAHSANATNIGDTLMSMETMLERLAPDGVDVKIECSHLDRPSFIDEGELEDTLLNLSLNAVDAMPGGGTLTVTCEQQTITPSSSAFAVGVLPNDYNVITVSDTGTGIPENILANIFEPFFTTKPKDRGTGLGLSMAYGFATRSNGYITVDSTPGKGTRFHIYLPCISSAPTSIELAEALSSDETPTGTETVLVVDDEPDLASVASNTLASLGYHVMNAANADEAISVLQDQGDQIDLVFTDIIMPGDLSGIELADIAPRMHPTIRCLITTGHARDRYDEEKVLWPLLMKPYVKHSLATAVRKVLDAPIPVKPDDI